MHLGEEGASLRSVWLRKGGFSGGCSPDRTRSRRNVAISSKTQIPDWHYQISAILFKKVIVFSVSIKWHKVNLNPSKMQEMHASIGY